MTRFAHLDANIRPPNTHIRFPTKGGYSLAHFHPNILLIHERKFLISPINVFSFVNNATRERLVEARTLWTFRLSVHGTSCWRRSVCFLKKPQKQVGKFLLLIKILGARGCGDILTAITDEILRGGTNSKTAYVTTFWSCKIHHQGLQEHSVAGFHFVTKLSSYCFLNLFGSLH